MDILPGQKPAPLSHLAMAHNEKRQAGSQSGLSKRAHFMQMGATCQAVNAILPLHERRWIPDAGALEIRRIQRLLQRILQLLRHQFWRRFHQRL
jgi:hypothetical protein